MFIAILINTSKKQTLMKNALIIIRHGQDIKDSWVDSSHDPRIANWISTVNSDWRNYDIDNTVLDVNSQPRSETNVAPNLHGLTDTPRKSYLEAGEKQAENLRDALDSWRADEGYAAINSAITKYPAGKIPKAPAGKDSPTPNPFDTIYPYLSKHPTKLTLIEPGNYHEQIIDPALETMIENSTLYPTNGSTLLCWDAEGLWGPDKDSEGIRIYNSNSILAKVSAHYLGDYKLIKDYSPEKGKTVFVFFDKNVNVYNFVNGVFSAPIFVK
jgi:hypothetical protein